MSCKGAATQGLNKVGGIMIKARGVVVVLELAVTAAAHAVEYRFSFDVTGPAAVCNPQLGMAEWNTALVTGIGADDISLDNLHNYLHQHQ